MAGPANWTAKTHGEEWEQDFLYPNRPIRLPELQERFDRAYDRSAVMNELIAPDKWRRQHIADAAAQYKGNATLYGNKTGKEWAGLRDFERNCGCRLQVSLVLKPKVRSFRAGLHHARHHSALHSEASPLPQP